MWELLVSSSAFLSFLYSGAKKETKKLSPTEVKVLAQSGSPIL